MLIRSATLSLIALAMSSTAAWAAPKDVAQRPDVTLALANALTTETLAVCKAEGRNAVAAVVDRGGNLVAVQRADNVGPHNTLAAVECAGSSIRTGPSPGWTTTGSVRQSIAQIRTVPSSPALPRWSHGIRFNYVKSGTLTSASPTGGPGACPRRGVWGLGPQKTPEGDQVRALREHRSPSTSVPPAGFEPAHPPPEGGALSSELRGP